MEVIADGLRVPEGPALLGDDGRVLFTEQTAGCLSVLGGDGRVDEYVYLGGAANSCVVGANGEVYVCQNGGVVGSWRSEDPRTPGIQRIDDDVSYVATAIGGRELGAPNDLAFAPDGRLCFTDPAQPFDPGDRRPAGAIYALGFRQDRLLETAGVYCNGIGFSASGEMLWAESYTRRLRVLRDGRPQTLCTLPFGHVPDGFATAADGRIFVATCGSHGLDVVSPDGEVLEFLYLDERANPTNCCFRGRALVVTDFGMDFEREPTAGRLWDVPVDATGARVWTGSVDR